MLLSSLPSLDFRASPTRHRIPSALVALLLVLPIVSPRFDSSLPTSHLPILQLLLFLAQTLFPSPIPHPPRTWISQRNLSNLLLAHVSPDRRHRNHHNRSDASHNDRVKVRRLVDRGPLEVSKRLSEEERGSRGASHDCGICTILQSVPAYDEVLWCMRIRDLGVSMPQCLQSRSVVGGSTLAGELRNAPPIGAGRFSGTDKAWQLHTSPIESSTIANLTVDFNSRSTR
jgi:hypothetical protein